LKKILLICGFIIVTASLNIGAWAQTFELKQNYPNPVVLGTTTTVEFSLDSTRSVSLTIHDILGLTSKTVIKDSLMSSGRHRIVINTGIKIPGQYVYRLSAGRNILTKRMVVTK